MRSPCLAHSTGLAGLVLTISLAAAAQAADKPVRLSCELDYGQTGPVVQVYRIDPAAGEVVAEPGSRFTREGVAENEGPLSSLGRIESWTADQIVVSTVFRSADGARTATSRHSLDLKTLTVVTTFHQTSPTLTFTPQRHEGRCRKIPFEAAG